MIPCILTEPSLEIVQRTSRTATAKPAPDWHRRFLALLPRIERCARIRFRSLASEAREEMVQETVARALVGYVRLVELGKEHVASATPLSHFAVSQVRAGRRVGASLNCTDVSSAYCQHRNGVTLQSLDRPDDAGGGWREVLVEDRHAGPADTAVMRIDFTDWLATLPRRSRRLAERLATGETTSAAAEWLGVSRGRISQLRSELRCAWRVFQGEPLAAGLV